MSIPGRDKSTPELLQDVFRVQTWEDFFLRTPCVKSSYLWGIGCGSIMMAHKLRIYKGNFRHAMNAGLLTCLAVSGMSFLICANDINHKYDQLRQAFHQQRIKEDPNSKK